jgi:hypothetical protein
VFPPSCWSTGNGSVAEGPSKWPRDQIPVRHGAENPPLAIDPKPRVLIAMFDMLSVGFGATVLDLFLRIAIHSVASTWTSAETLEESSRRQRSTLSDGSAATLSYHRPGPAYTSCSKRSCQAMSAKPGGSRFTIRAGISR